MKYFYTGFSRQYPVLGGKGEGGPNFGLVVRRGHVPGSGCLRAEVVSVSVAD
jgi:hypothetical protein